MKPRLFGLLSALNALAAVAGFPYSRALALQGVGSKLIAQWPVHVALPVLVVGQLVIALPCAAVGLALAPRLGLGAPVLSAWLAREPIARRAREALLPALWIGLALGAILTGVNALLGDSFERELLRAGRSMPVHPHPLIGVLASFSAGVAEETMLRLGLFTVVVWLGASIALRGALASTESPAAPIPAGAFHVANVFAALVFGALHFANVKALGLSLSPTSIFVALGLNGLVGLACGFLYWKRGIEAAMVAHTATDLVIHALVPALAPGA